MNATEVELLVRGVIVRLELPFTVLSVIGSPAGWDIVVRASLARVVRFTVARGQPGVMRAAIQQTLEAQG
jgi:hypothetical protein